MLAILAENLRCIQPTAVPALPQRVLRPTSLKRVHGNRSRAAQLQAYCLTLIQSQHRRAAHLPPTPARQPGGPARAGQH